MLGAPACQLFKLPGRAHDHSQVIADQTCINFFLWVSEKSLYIGQPVQRLSPATSAGTATLGTCSRESRTFCETTPDFHSSLRVRPGQGRWLMLWRVTDSDQSESQGPSRT